MNVTEWLLPSSFSFCYLHQPFTGFRYQPPATFTCTLTDPFELMLQWPRLCLCSSWHWDETPDQMFISSIFIPPPPPNPHTHTSNPVYTGGCTGITLSICPSVYLSVVLSVNLIVSAQYLLNHLTIFFTKFGMVVYYHEAMCHAEKLVHYFQCQGHNEGLYYQNWTTFTISSKLLACLQPNLVW